MNDHRSLFVIAKKSESIQSIHFTNPSVKILQSVRKYTVTRGRPVPGTRLGEEEWDSEEQKHKMSRGGSSA